MNKAADIVNEGAAEFLPDGVYVDLPETIYFAQDALGSSDIRKLIADPIRWWWQSPHNALLSAGKPKTPEMIIGSAWHCLALEGEKAFHARYVRGPEKYDFAGLLETSADIKAKIAELGHKPDGKVKDDLITQLVRIDDSVHIWDRIQAAAALDPRTPLRADDYTQIIMAASAVSMNDDFTALRPGSFCELSIFWTENDVRRRARLDMIGPRGFGELKSVRIANGLPSRGLMRTLDRERYDVQAADHKRAVLAAYDFLDGLPKELKRALTCQPNYTWFFWDKLSGPSIHPVTSLIGGELWDAVDLEITQATENYRRLRAQFGMEGMWRQINEPIAYEPGASWMTRVVEEIGYASEAA